jgi:hypothetical protein
VPLRSVELLDLLAEKRLGELYAAWDRFRRAKPFCI